MSLQTHQPATPITSKGIMIVTGTALAFGALSIMSGGRVLFGPTIAREAVGNAVTFVLWFNFLSGFVYMLVGFAIAQRAYWAKAAAIGLAAAILIVFALFGGHIAMGGAYEMRTVWAMALRAAVWIAIALYLYAIASQSPLKP